MRYLLLFCLLFLFSSSYAFVPNSNIEKNNVVLKEENNSTKIKQQKKTDKKNKRQLKKQTQKLKWQLLKNALKFNKSAKKFDQQNKKDKNPIYFASWLSALLGGLAISLVLLFDVFALGIFLLFLALGLGGLVLAILSLSFIINNRKEKNDTYNKTFSIIFTIIRLFIGILSLMLVIALLTFSLSL